MSITDEGTVLSTGVAVSGTTTSTAYGAALYALTTDSVGGGSTGAAQIDLSTFGPDPISGTNVNNGKRCLAAINLEFNSSSGTSYTSAQASRGIQISSGSDSSNAVGAMFHASGMCYYAVFNASNATSVSGSAVAALRMAPGMGIDFSTAPGTATSLNNRVLLFNSSTANLEYQVASGAPATSAVVSITDAGSIIAKGAAIQESSTGTFATTYTPNFNVQGNFTLTLTGNLTLANPSAMTPGAQGYILLTQDGTGGRTISFGSQYVFAGGVAPALSTAANAIDMLNYTVIGSAKVAVALTKGLAA